MTGNQRSSQPGGGDHASASSLANRRMVIATMHGKEQAIEPVFRKRLGVEAVLSADLDTDAFGTFSGEIARTAPARETAIAKARLGMKRAAVDAGLASEGTYGAHPVFGVIPGGSEVMVFVDNRLGITVAESIITEGTNFNHRVVTPEDDIHDFLSKTGFPHHALIVRPNKIAEGSPQILKGLKSLSQLHRAIRQSAAASEDGCAYIETDMRAHMNPTRMEAIKALAEKLADRLACDCPRCSLPGYGQVERIPGLPCSECGAESTLVKSLVYGCAGCSYAEERARPDGLTHSSPTYCTSCNP